MLVLNREIGQTLMIGDDIQIDIVSISRGRVRIGIIAPKSVAVHRKEVYEAIKREKAEKNKGQS